MPLGQHWFLGAWFTRPLGVCCGVLHQDVGSASCGLQGEVYLDHTCLSGASNGDQSDKGLESLDAGSASHGPLHSTPVRSGL